MEISEDKIREIFREEVQNVLNNLLGIILLSASNLQENLDLGKNTLGTMDGVTRMAKDFKTKHILVSAEIVPEVVKRSRKAKKK